MAAKQTRAWQQLESEIRYSTDPAAQFSAAELLLATVARGKGGAAELRLAADAAANAFTLSPLDRALASQLAGAQYGISLAALGRGAERRSQAREARARAVAAWNRYEELAYGR